MKAKKNEKDTQRGNDLLGNNRPKNYRLGNFSLGNDILGNDRSGIGLPEIGLTGIGVLGNGVLDEGSKGLNKKTASKAKKPSQNGEVWLKEPGMRAVRLEPVKVNSFVFDHPKLKSPRLSNFSFDKNAKLAPRVRVCLNVDLPEIGQPFLLISLREISIRFLEELLLTDSFEYINPSDKARDALNNPETK
jgi:hypothetical protein